MSSLKNRLVQEVIKVHATVVGSGGNVVLSEEFPTSGGSTQFRNAQLEKYPKGQELLLSMTLRGAERVMLSESVIKPSDRFALVLTEFLEEETEEYAASIVKSHFGLKKLDSDTIDISQKVYERMIKQLTTNASKDTSFGVIVLDNTTYKPCLEMKKKLIDLGVNCGILIVGTHTENYNENSRVSDLLIKAGAASSATVSDVEWVGNIWIQPQVREVFRVAENVVRSGDVLNALLLGDSGNGKTSTGEALAEWLGIDFVRVNVAMMLDGESWFGSREAIEGSTVFKYTEFAQKVKNGRVVALLDEVNRAEPWIHNTLFPILDHARRTYVNGEEFKVGKGVIFLMSANIGVEFAGTNVLDKAFKNRVAFTAEMTGVPRHVEKRRVESAYPSLDKKVVNGILDTIEKIREHDKKNRLSIDISTRSVVGVANLVHYGMSVRTAFEGTIVTPAQPHERKDLIDIINSLHGVLAYK